MKICLSLSPANLRPSVHIRSTHPNNNKLSAITKSRVHVQQNCCSAVGMGIALVEGHPIFETFGGQLALATLWICRDKLFPRTLVAVLAADW